MRVSEKTLKFSKEPKNSIETATWRIEYDDGAYVFDAGRGKTCVIEGDLYYYLDKDSKPVRFKPKDKTPKFLSALYAKLKGGFSEKVEGIYNAAIIDKKIDTVTVFGDAFARVNLFYTDKCQVISTEIEDVLAHFGLRQYDQAALVCMLLLGYAPLKHTQYAGLCRLAVGEVLVLKDGRITRAPATPKPLKTVVMNGKNLLEYEKLLENSILSRASDKENWVEISGGWDSTVILGVLRKYFEKKKVKASVLAFKFKDGRTYNPYEVDKSKEIAKHYGVKVSVIPMEFGSPSLPDVAREVRKLQRSDMVYLWPSYHIIAEPVRQTGKPGASVFVGSFSDALHNFGFSQFASMPYLSYDFREYSDKVHSYLYSPEFLAKVKNNTFEGDFAYKLFKWSNPSAKFVDVSGMTEKERIFEYLLSFVLSMQRIPFADSFAEPIFTEEAKAKTRKWLYDNYFKDAVENINEGTMYFWLIWLYQHFHMQGFERGAVRASLKGTDKRPCWSFYDMLLVRFLQSMPQDWGRGVEWRHIKYPLKHYAKERLKIPYEIVESTFHSYIDETDQHRAVDWRTEVMDNSSLTDTVWKETRNADLNRFFDSNWYNTELLGEAMKTGKSATGTSVPFMLLTITSVLGAD